MWFTLEKIKKGIIHFPRCTSMFNAIKINVLTARNLALKINGSWISTLNKQFGYDVNSTFADEVRLKIAQFFSSKMFTCVENVDYK